MSKINLTPNASGTGVFTIASPNSNTDYTLTLPEVTGGDFIVSDASGNVGIGTASPQRTLHVSSGATNVVTRFESTDSVAVAEFKDNAGTVEIGCSGNDVILAPAGVERMRIDSSGDVGIGVSPAFTAGGSRKLLQIANSTNGAQIAMSNSSSESENPRIFSDSTNLGFATAATGGGELEFYTAGSKNMRISDAGNVYLGTDNDWFTASGRKILRVHGASGGSFLVLDTSGSGDFYIGSENNGVVNFWNQANADLVFATNNTERMRILPSGNIGMGLSSDYYSAKLAVGQSGGNPAIACRTTNSSGTVALVLFTDGNSQDCGSIDVNTTANTTNYGTSSDQRLKENIVDAPSGNIDDVRVRSFDWKSSGHHQTYGLVAQELVDVAPEAVSQGKKEEDTWKVDPSKLVPMMIKEIQDLKAKLAALEAR